MPRTEYATEKSTNVFGLAYILLNTFSDPFMEMELVVLARTTFPRRSVFPKLEKVVSGFWMVTFPRKTHELSEKSTTECRFPMRDVLA